MFKPLAAASLASALCVAAVSSQTPPPPNPTQQTGVTRQQVPVYRIVTVARTTPAINYRPRDNDTKIDFTGTNLMPKARGEATVSGQKGHMKIATSFSKLDPPSTFGREYLTYVLWAITPEGRAKNLGELQVKDKESDPKTEVTTAEDAKKRDQGDNAIMMPARQAVQTAEDARLIALNGR